MTKRNDVQDKITNMVRELSRAGHSDEEIIATLTDSIMAALKERRWGKPWMDAMQATLARIQSEGSKGLLHN